MEVFPFLEPARFNYGYYKYNSDEYEEYEICNTYQRNIVYLRANIKI